MSINVSCPLCGSTTVQLLCHSLSNADGPLIEKIQLFICLKCNANFTDPRIYKKDINQIQQYEVGIYQSKKNRLSRMVDVFLAVLIDQKIKKIASMRKPDVNLLDVGCGKGRFLSRVKKREGWLGLGIEPSQRQAEFGVENYGVKVVTGNLTNPALAGSVFDVVTCWHVLEHIDDPAGFVASINKLLGDDGLLVIEVPNFGSFQAVLGKGKWFHLDTPRHMFHYTKKSIERLLNNSGFYIQKIETYSFDLGTFGMLQTILNVLNISPNLFFRWLKRCKLNEGKVEIISNLILAAILAVPSMVLEFVVSIALNSGGVLRIYAKKKTNPHIV